MVTVIVMVILLQACVMVFLLTMAKDSRASRYFYAPSLLIAWVGYIAYETFTSRAIAPVNATFALICC
jgi:bacteriorhodopsin